MTFTHSAEVTRLKKRIEELEAELSATGDTRHLVMEASIKVQQSYSKQISKLKAENAKLRETLKMAGPYKYHGEYLLVPESDIERMQAENAALKDAIAAIYSEWYVWRDDPQIGIDDIESAVSEAGELIPPPEEQE